MGPTSSPRSTWVASGSSTSPTSTPRWSWPAGGPRPARVPSRCAPSSPSRAPERLVAEPDCDNPRDDPHRDNPHRDNPHRADPHRDNPHRADPQRADPHRADPHRADPQRADPQRADPQRADLDRVFRAEHGRVVATLARRFGDIDIAEEAAQEAYLIALQRWPESGPPPNPGAWLTTTAQHRAIDRIRRESTRDSRQAQAAMISDTSDFAAEPISSVVDDRLRLMFTCCHPALAASAQVALTLRLLGGLTVAEIASGFLVDEAAMAKRLTRSKQKIKAARIPYRV